MGTRGPVVLVFNTYFLFIYLTVLLVPAAAMAQMGSMLMHWRKINKRQDTDNNGHAFLTLIVSLCVSVPLLFVLLSTHQHASWHLPTHQSSLNDSQLASPFFILLAYY